LHRDHGVDLRCGTKIEAIEGTKRVERVRLSDGMTIDCDAVIWGTGAEPATDWLRSSGLTLADGVVCRADLSTPAPGVYAAGDVARWPNPAFAGRSMRLEHWTSAAEQASHAVRSWLAGARAKEFTTVPYFWSDWYESRIQCVGVADGSAVIAAGSVDEGRLLTLYRQDDRLIGALSVNWPSLIMKYRAMVARGAGWDEAMSFTQRNCGHGHGPARRSN
jgi:NADPH-dependent 2,4-dienoyl-CoA reductase/sulfur reductase-like enzyme